MRRTIGIAMLPAAALLAVAMLDILSETGAASQRELVLDLIEKALMAAAMAAITWSIIDLRDLRQSQRALRDRVVHAAGGNGGWRIERAGEIAAFGDAVAHQFRAWDLSPAETDVAALLLKGASMKQIARARNTSEATVRQQAQSLYHKAGISGRAELSAYFLDSVFASPGTANGQDRVGA